MSGTSLLNLLDDLESSLSKYQSFQVTSFRQAVISDADLTQYATGRFNSQLTRYRTILTFVQVCGLALLVGLPFASSINIHRFTPLHSAMTAS